MSSIVSLLDSELIKVFDSLNYDKKSAFFVYSDRPDLSDFQTNCAMSLARELKKNPREIATTIVEKLNDIDFFEKITIDGPGFINITLKNDFLQNYLNGAIDDKNFGYRHSEKQKTVVIDFGGYNIAKELHVGHLRSTVIGESVRRIFNFCGDKIIGDVHYGDWGTNMGMVIEGLKIKYPNAKCFSEGFIGDTIDDLNLTSADLMEVYRLSTSKAKEDESFMAEVKKSTKMLQDGYKPYKTLWKYFTKISMDDAMDMAKIFNTNFDMQDGESTVHDLMVWMIDGLEKKGFVVASEGAKVIFLDEYNLPPALIEKSDGAFMYASSDLATILNRRQKINPDIMLYIVDYRQSLHFQQVFAASKKVGYLNNSYTAEHCPFGTMNGKDGKPFKTRSGDTVRLRELIEETVEKIKEKSTIDSDEDIQKIAVSCIKFADLINFRESNYIFDMDSFTSYEGKTGAYILYSLVRINSILRNYDNFETRITSVRTSEERELLIELSRFNFAVSMAYAKRAPNYIADYVFNLAKKFSSFYGACNIKGETDVECQKSRLSLINMAKKYMEKCLELLGMEWVEKM